MKKKNFPPPPNNHAILEHPASDPLFGPIYTAGAFVIKNPQVPVELYPDAVEPVHYGTKPGHFETSKIHFPTTKGVSKVSERANE